MYLPTGIGQLDLPDLPAAGGELIDIELLDSPELIDLLAQREMSLQGLTLGDLDALDRLSWKKIRRSVSRGVKRIGRQAKKVGKKYVRTVIRIGTLGLSDFQRAVTRTKKQLRQAKANLAAARTPAERLRWQNEVNRLTQKLQKKRRNRTRVIKAAAIVGAVATAGLVSGPLLKGAFALGKSGAFKTIAGLLIKSGMARKNAETMAETMVEYPPDPALMDPQAMFADSMQKQANARERAQEPLVKALPWIGAGAAALLAVLV